MQANTILMIMRTAVSAGFISPYTNPNPKIKLFSSFPDPGPSPPPSFMTIDISFCIILLIRQRQTDPKPIITLLHAPTLSPGFLDYFPTAAGKTHT